MGKHESERVKSELSKAIQLVSGRAKAHTQVCVSRIWANMNCQNYNL